MNYASIDHGINELHQVEIPERWLDARDEPQADTAPAFIQDVVAVMNRQEGDSLPVSTMVKYGLEDGTWPAGTSQYEKRGRCRGGPGLGCEQVHPVQQVFPGVPPTPPSGPFCWTAPKRPPSPLALRQCRPGA